MEMTILFEDAQLVVAIKPAKVPSQKDLSGDLDMVTAISMHLEHTSGKERPYVGLIHRLDRPVSGIMVFAKTAQVNAKLSEQIRLHKMTKQYLVVVSGQPILDQVTLTDFLMKQGNNISKVVKKGAQDAKEAVLRYECLKTIEHDTYGTLSLLKVDLITGRHHQIRVQLSHGGLPIWGDTKYNPAFFIQEEPGKKAWYQIALCAFQLTFYDPKSNTPKTFQMEPEQFPFDLF